MLWYNNFQTVPSRRDSELLLLDLCRDSMAHGTFLYAYHADGREILKLELNDEDNPTWFSLGVLLVALRYGTEHLLRSRLSSWMVSADGPGLLTPKSVHQPTDPSTIHG